MTTLPLLPATRSPLARDEAPIGLCLLFAGLIWGLLASLAADSSAERAIVAGAGVLLGALLFASRELVLARAASGRARR